MSIPLGISELVRLAGDENIQVQNLLQNTVDLNNGKKGSSIRFMTDPAMVKAFMDASLYGGKASHVGLVLWIPTEIIDEINAGLRTVDESKDGGNARSAS